MSKKRATKIGRNPRGKETIISTPPSGFWYYSPSWRFSEIDLDFDHLTESWKTCDVMSHNNIAQTPSFCLIELQHGLKSFESLIWKEILQEDVHRNHGIKLDLLRQKNPKAFRRLKEKYANRVTSGGIDEIYSLRITAQKRIFGFIDSENGVFSVIWWDPQHRIYPVEKSHT